MPSLLLDDYCSDVFFQSSQGHHFWWMEERKCGKSRSIWVFLWCRHLLSSPNVSHRWRHQYRNDLSFGRIVTQRIECAGKSRAGVVLVQYPTQKIKQPIVWQQQQHNNNDRCIQLSILQLETRLVLLRKNDYSLFQLHLVDTHFISICCCCCCCW